MPAHDQHMKQAEHNEKLLAHTKTIGDNTEFCDWGVTIAFYAALHYFEAMVAVIKPRVGRNVRIEHCHDHISRNKMIKLMYPSLHPPYSALYKYGRLAKYNCYTPYTLIRANAEKRLDAIKTECQKLKASG